MFHLHRACFRGVCFKQAIAISQSISRQHQPAHLVSSSTPASSVLLLHVHWRALQGRRRWQLLVAESSTCRIQNQAFAHAISKCTSSE
jgi:hypothetical protein